MFGADFIVVGSDSGRIVILEYLPAKNAFEKVLHFYSAALNAWRSSQEKVCPSVCQTCAL